MKNKIEWQRHTIELLVIFIGITAAFLLNNWREGHKDARLETRYVHGFASDLEGDAAQLRTILPAYERKAADLAAFIHLGREGRAEAADAAVGILGDMLVLHPYEQARTTYESIKNSGNLNLLSDYELRRELIQYYEQFSDIKTREGIFYDWLNGFIIPFVYENMDLERQRLVTERSIQTVEFGNLLIGYSLLLQQMIEIYKEMAELNVALQAAVSQFLY